MASVAPRTRTTRALNGDKNSDANSSLRSTAGCGGRGGDALASRTRVKTQCDSPDVILLDDEEEEVVVGEGGGGGRTGGGIRGRRVEGRQNREETVRWVRDSVDFSESLVSSSSQNAVVFDVESDENESESSVQGSLRSGSFSNEGKAGSWGNSESRLHAGQAEIGKIHEIDGSREELEAESNGHSIPVGSEEEKEDDTYEDREPSKADVEVEADDSSSQKVIQLDCEDGNETEEDMALDDVEKDWGSSVKNDELSGQRDVKESDEDGAKAKEELTTDSCVAKRTRSSVGKQQRVSFVKYFEEDESDDDDADGEASQEDVPYDHTNELAAESMRSTFEGRTDGCKEKGRCSASLLKKRRFSVTNIPLSVSNTETSTGGPASRGGFGISVRTQSHFDSKLDEKENKPGIATETFCLDVDESDELFGLNKEDKKGGENGTNGGEREGIKLEGFRVGKFQKRERDRPLKHSGIQICFDAIFSHTEKLPVDSFPPKNESYCEEPDFFSFGVPKGVEKSDSEKAMDELWADFEFAMGLENIGTYNADKETNTWEKSEWKCFSSESGQLHFNDLCETLTKLNGQASHSHLCGTVWDLIPGVYTTMYEHQQEAFEFMWRNLAGGIHLDELKSGSGSDVLGGCVISHAPGTGKTRLSIVFIQTYMKVFPECRPVIIAPSGMLLTWEEEARKWDVSIPIHNLNSLEYNGKEDKEALSLAEKEPQRSNLIRLVKLCSWGRGNSILGISYNLFKQLTSKASTGLSKILLEKPGLLVLDEGHIPRNERSLIWKVLGKVKTEKRIILSGTPFQNNFVELYNILCLVRPKFAEKISNKTLKSCRKQEIFLDKEQAILAGENGGKGIWATLTSDVTNDNVEEVRSILKPFVHVHNGSILKNLPGLRECLIVLDPLPQQKSIIEKIKCIGSHGNFEREYKVCLASIHPSLVTHLNMSEEEESLVDTNLLEKLKLSPVEGAKTRFVIEVVRLCDPLNEKVLIFSQYIQPLVMIKEQLINEFGWNEGKEVLQMDGKILTKNRQPSIDIFNDTKGKAKVLLASTKACCEGISLTGASRVILLDVVWNPAVGRQAISRAYRIGQKKFVYAYNLITFGTAVVSAPLRTTRSFFVLRTISKMSLGHEVVVLPRTARLVVAFLLASVLTYACLWLPEVSIPSMFRLTTQKDELQRQLEGASMANRTLIIGVISNASAEDDSILQLFLQSMREGEETRFLIKHILFAAADPTAYNNCMVLQLHCYQLYTGHVFTSPDASSQNASYTSLTRTQTLFLGEVLGRGFSFIFTEMDVMWLKNPFARLSHSGEDMLLSHGVYDGHRFEEFNSTNSGLYFVSSNEKTTALFKQSYAVMHHSKSMREDDALYVLRSEEVLRQLDMKVGYLDPTSFGSFCQDNLDITKVITVHANCCPSNKAKIEDLTAMLDARKAYNGTFNATIPAHGSCSQSWKTYQLETALQGASMGNKTVIISYLNKAYVDENGMLDLFLRSLTEGESTAFLIKHLFLITVDQISFERCRTLNLHCYRPVTEGLNFSKEQLFMSAGYIDLVWQKILILGQILEHGYNFIFTDMDVIWLRNPFAKLNLNGEDFQISCDRYNGSPFDDSNSINTGFFFVRSNNKTIKLFDMWSASRESFGQKHDQDVLAALKSAGVFKQLGISVRYLDTLYFSTFCQDSESFKEVTTVHGNCCRSIKAKIDDLTAALQTWKKFDGTTALTWPKHIACIQSWRD
ncbi:unnamed protein product [Musa acuminata var. zebrina]